MDESLKNRIQDALIHVEPNLSSTSATKFDDLKRALSKWLRFSADEIYVSSVDRSSNANTRFQQMYIRREIDWKVFVGICTGNDLESASYLSAASKALAAKDLPNFEGAIWLQKQRVGGAQAWTVSLAHVRQGSALAKMVSDSWPKAKVVPISAQPPTAQQAASQPLPLPMSSGEAELDETFLEAFVRDAEAAGLLASHAIGRRLVASLLAKPFLICTGLSGSGKTKLIQAFARWLSPKRTTAQDVFKPGSEIKSDRISYFVRNSDDLSVDFANTRESAGEVRVVLSRQLIREWADVIAREGFSESTPARTIRDVAGVGSSFSSQLHSFETHLKAAALALLGAGQNSGSIRTYELVPVGADWMSSESVFGYPDGLDAKKYVSRPTLELILEARHNRDIPHFLILDEMNLSHVERYFSDVLSLIESGEGVSLYSGDQNDSATWRVSGNGVKIPPRLKSLPKNLFVIGTVNVDETTYMFSPKVLDRANVIEFQMSSEEMSRFLSNPTKPSMRKIDQKGYDKGYHKTFLASSKKYLANPAILEGDEFQKEMGLFFDALKSSGSEFGYRTAFESGALVYFHGLMTTGLENKERFQGGFDLVVAQKLLPKLHGSRQKLGPLLRKIWFLCTNEDRGPDAANAAEAASRSSDKKDEPVLPVAQTAPYPVSANKVARMWKALAESGFTSFAEA